MRRIIASILVAGLLVILGAFAAIYAGAYNVAATEPHSPITRWIMETARMRSIKAHAAGITVPPGLDDPAKIPIGVEHFAAHCAVCHGARRTQGGYRPGTLSAAAGSCQRRAALYPRRAVLDRQARHQDDRHAG